MATNIALFKEIVEKNNINLKFFCHITKFDFSELNFFLNKNDSEFIPEYFAQALIHFLENKAKMEEKEFLYKAELLGFKIININSISKIEINLQKPIGLSEDFELPSKFNHLVHYTI